MLINKLKRDSFYSMWKEKENCFVRILNPKTEDHTTGKLYECTSEQPCAVLGQNRIYKPAMLWIEKEISILELV